MSGLSSGWVRSLHLLPIPRVRLNSMIQRLQRAGRESNSKMSGRWKRPGGTGDGGRFEAADQARRKMLLPSSSRS